MVTHMETRRLHNREQHVMLEGVQSFLKVFPSVTRLIPTLTLDYNAQAGVSMGTRDFAMTFQNEGLHTIMGDLMVRHCQTSYLLSDYI